MFSVMSSVTSAIAPRAVTNGSHDLVGVEVAERVGRGLGPGRGATQRATDRLLGPWPLRRREAVLTGDRPRRLDRRVRARAGAW
ncbi:hypothetical protein ACWEN6_23985 [Sphaerisporangium sp. NPDC004334]